MIVSDSLSRGVTNVAESKPPLFGKSRTRGGAAARPTSFAFQGRQWPVAAAVGGAPGVESPSCPRRLRRPSETLRPLPSPNTLVPWPPAGTRLAATPEGGGSGSGGAAARSGPRVAEGFGDAEGGTLRAAREPEGAPASAETMAEEEGDCRGVQRASGCLWSREGGRGRWRCGLELPVAAVAAARGGREGARRPGEGCGEIQESGANGSKFCRPNWEAKAELKVGNP